MEHTRQRWIVCIQDWNCCIPSLGLTTKARACESAGQEGSPKVTFHATGSAKECEGMNPHTPKRTSTLGVGVPIVATLALGSRPRRRFARVRAKRSVKECEDEDSHSPKWASILGVGVPVGSQTFREQLQKSKHLALRSSLYRWKAIEVWMSKMGSHKPFGHL
jgi:hypothetical protein